jgi:hypothetical protein
VKRRDERTVEQMLQTMSNRAREPIVAVQDVDGLFIEHAFRGCGNERLDELM